MRENTSSMAQVSGSLSGSSVPAFPPETKVYHERNFELLKINPIWLIADRLMNSGRFKPRVSVFQTEHGKCLIEDFRIRVVRKTFQPNSGGWSETVVYVMEE